MPFTVCFPPALLSTAGINVLASKSIMVAIVVAQANACHAHIALSPGHKPVGDSVRRASTDETENEQAHHIRVAPHHVEEPRRCLRVQIGNTNTDPPQIHAPHTTISSVTR